MKEISVTETVHVTKYVAVDNTVFTNKSECEKYEQTAECALMQKYKPLVVKTVTEYDIFACGSEDSVVDVIKLTEAKDIDTVIQLYRLRNSHLERPEYKKWIDEAHKKLSAALQGSGFVFVGRGCDDDCFWIIGSQESVMQVIKDACKPEEKKDDAEGENHGA